MSESDLLGRLLESRAPTSPRLLSVSVHGAISDAPPAARVVVPGSFDPLHEGHERLAAVGAELAGGDAAFELSVVNVDKPPLTAAEVHRRLLQFRGRWPVVLTRAPTFVEKARLLPGRVFCAGWDTAARIVEPRYYGDDERAMLNALAAIRDAGCRFLVAGRAQDGVFRTLADVAIPHEFVTLFEAIPESRFRVDISSTTLRPSGVDIGSGKGTVA